jgi:hypothetical protein
VATRPAPRSPGTITLTEQIKDVGRLIEGRVRRHPHTEVAVLPGSRYAMPNYGWHP